MLPRKELAHVLAQSVLIISLCQTKIDRLRYIKNLLGKELGKIEGLGEKDAVSSGSHERIESFVDEFKRILTEIRVGSVSEEAITLEETAVINTNEFMRKYTQDSVGADTSLAIAFDCAEKAVLETAKAKLQVKEEHHVIFTVPSHRASN